MSQKWIICELNYKNVRRQLMSPNRYTELFFLDEVTALAAGHRPCTRCRRPAATKFLQLSTLKSIASLDAQLHQERMLNGPTINDVSTLPNGVIVGWNFTPYLIWNGEIYRWSYAGYDHVHSIKADITSKGEKFEDFPVQLLTPLTTVEILRQDYNPQVALV